MRVDVGLHRRLKPMPYTVRLLPAHRLGVVRFTGDLTIEDALACIADLLDAPGWDPAWTALWDSRAMGRVFLGPDDIARIVAAVGARRGRLTRAATVVPPTGHMHIVASLAVHLLRPLSADLRVFTTTDEAAAWIGVGVDVLDADAPEPGSLSGAA